MQGSPSDFDLLGSHARQSVGDATNDPRSGERGYEFDLLFVLEDRVCNCGCGQAGCSCSAIAGCRASQISNLKSQMRKPIVRMKSASWCGVCRTAKQEIGEAKDCPFELVVDPNENAQTALPEFTWEAGGKWWTPVDPATGQPRPGYFGLKDLVTHWESTQRKNGTDATYRTHESHQSHSVAAQVAARVEELARAKIRSPPAFGQPGDSAKKSPPLTNAGGMTSGDASGKKSAGKFGTSTRPSTPSRS